MKFVLALSAMTFSMAVLAASPAKKAETFTSPEPAVISAAISQLGNGDAKVCVPDLLTVDGMAKSKNGGERQFLVSATPELFPAAVASARKKISLSKKQLKAIQDFHGYAVSALKSGENFAPGTVDAVARETGMFVEARMVCVSRETVSADGGN